MKTNKKKKVIDVIENYEKKIGDAKNKLNKLEERKEALIAESVVETLKESNYSLSDFFKIMAEQNKGTNNVQTSESNNKNVHKTE